MGSCGGTGGVALFKSLLTLSISTSLCMSAVGWRGNRVHFCSSVCED